MKTRANWSLNTIFYDSQRYDRVFSGDRVLDRKYSLPHWFPIVDRNTLPCLPSVTPKQWVKLPPDNPNVPQHGPDRRSLPACDGHMELAWFNFRSRALLRQRVWPGVLH